MGLALVLLAVGSLDSVPTAALTATTTHRNTHGISVDGVPVVPRRLLYLVQGPDVPSWLQSVVAWPDVAAIFLSFKRDLGEVAYINRTIFLPESTWTTGRNALYNESRKFQVSLGWAFEYLVFSDDDLAFVGSRPTHIVLFQLHGALLQARPAVGALYLARSRRHCVGKNETNCACAGDIDALWNAFHASAAPFYLPYHTVFDRSSWWMSQAVIIRLLQETAPQHVVTFPTSQFAVNNSEHRPYPKSVSWRQVKNYLASNRSGTSSCFKKKNKLARFRHKSWNRCRCASQANASLALDYSRIISCHPFGN